MDKLIVSLLILFILVACGKVSLESVQGQWVLISYGSPSNQIAAVPNADASIEFDSEGRMTGNVGCNGFGGEYETDGNAIIFSPIETTLMFCEGQVGDQELVTLAALSESATFVVENNLLTITSENGESSITLEQK